MVCLKCGAVIANGSKFCSECGCATDVVNESGAVAVQEQLSGNIEYSSQRKMFIIGIVMCICSVILFVFGYRSMTDTKYKHAIENVDYFESQMDETKSMASLYGGSGLLGGGYSELASSWESMLEDAKKEILIGRIKIGIGFVGGIIFLIVGMIFAIRNYGAFRTPAEQAVPNTSRPQIVNQGQSGGSPQYNQLSMVHKGRIYALMAALCFAICLFYGISQKIFTLIHFNYNSITWDFVVCRFVQLGFIVLLVIAKKNIGFLFFSGIEMIMNIYYVVLFLSAGNVCALVASIMLFVTFLFNIISNTNNSAIATKIFGIIAVIIRFAGILITWVRWQYWEALSSVWLQWVIQIIGVAAVLFLVIWLVSTQNAKENDAKYNTCAPYNTQ